MLKFALWQISVTNISLFNYSGDFLKMYFLTKQDAQIDWNKYTAWYKNRIFRI
jgi:hypothetical protein